MTRPPGAWDRMRRGELIEAARAYGIVHPELLTRDELRDEILRRTAPAESGPGSRRGWLGVARDLLARLVERGLNLPDAAALIRGQPVPRQSSRLPPPVATVTLAEIYAAQGHEARALQMLDDVLAKEPDHEAARSLRERLSPLGGGADRARPGYEPAEPADSVLRDAVVATVEPGHQTYTYWQISAATLRHLQQSEPEGQAVVRVLSFIPSWQGARRDERDVTVDGPVGMAQVSMPHPEAAVRAVLGWRSPAGFRPLAIGTTQTRDGQRIPSWVPPRQVGHEQSAVEQRARKALAPG